MARVLLIHWKESELPQRVADLRNAGYDVMTHSSQVKAPSPPLGKPLDAILIDLSRLPSHGRACGYGFRQQKATREIPLVFLDGDPAKVRSVREMLPDATYTTWESVGTALRQAIAEKPGNPVVPTSTSGYSDTPLPKKLGADKAQTVALIGAPNGFDEQIRGADGGPQIRRGGRTPSDLVIWFAKSQAELQKGLAAAKKWMSPGGGLWVCWPKKTSGVVSDLSDEVIRETCLKSGLVDYKVCAIDETWSGLKFARRRR